MSVSGECFEPALHRILIVDDEEIVLVALREVLRREGYQVDTASDADEALKLVSERTYSVLMTDQLMPGLTGLELLEEVKKVQPDATRILITAVLSLNTVIDAINKGEIFRFIVKPWIREELLATVRNAFQRYELVCKNSVLRATMFSVNERLTKTQKALAQMGAKVEDQNRELRRIHNTLEENVNHWVRLSVRMIETFYPPLGPRSQQVYDLCKAMGKDLELGAEERKILEVGARLHDIGLAGLSRSLIKRWRNAPESLTDGEKALIEQHPVMGERLAEFGPSLPRVGEVLRGHHERYDGAGYPDGLAGEQIPWLARLLAVAVAYVDVAEGGGPAEEELRAGSGKAFDPDALRALLRSRSKVLLPARQKEVLLSELKPGMVLVRGVYSASGVLLIPDGQQLNETYIAKLKNHNQVSPIAQSLVVTC